MLNDNLLENRLNEFKNKTTSSESYIDPSKSSLFSAISFLFSGVLVVFRAFVFGYALKLAFSTDWKWWQFLTVGIAINFFLTYIHDLVRSKKHI